MIRVSSRFSAASASASSPLIRSIISSGEITSGSKRTSNEALAGQISVTPGISASRTSLLSDRLMKKASSDISSSTST